MFLVSNNYRIHGIFALPPALTSIHVCAKEQMCFKNTKKRAEVASGMTSSQGSLNT